MAQLQRRGPPEHLRPLLRLLRQQRLLCLGPWGSAACWAPAAVVGWAERWGPAAGLVPPVQVMLLLVLQVLALLVLLSLLLRVLLPWVLLLPVLHLLPA